MSALGTRFANGILAALLPPLLSAGCASRAPINDAAGASTVRGSTAHKVTLTWPDWQQQGQAQIDDTTTLACVTRVVADYRSGRLEVTVRIRSNFRQQLVVPRGQVKLLLAGTEYGVTNAHSRRDADLWIQGHAASSPWTLQFQALLAEGGTAKLRFVQLRLVDGDQQTVLGETLEVVVPIPKQSDA